MSELRESVIDVITGRWRGQILHAGVRLGIFEALADAPLASARVAAQLELDPAHTYRLMRALASIGLLSEAADRVFSVTPAGELLLRRHPQSLRGMALLEEGPELYAAWRHLPAMVKEGRQDGFSREFGHGVFAHIAHDAAFAATFNEAMSSYSTGETAMVAEALASIDFSKVAHLCDVGGGHGHLLCSLLAQRPHIRGTVYEVPATLTRPELLWASRMGLADRVAYVEGDMFEKVPAADAYILKHILHDWNDGECVRILSNIRAAASPGAVVWVAEFVVPGPATPHFSKLFDVHMMCATTGRERTEQEYAELLEKAGWRDVKTRYPASGMMGVVEARRT